MYVSVEVPEISEYPQGFPMYWMKLFIGTASTNYQVNALTGTYIRLVEAALVEYRLGASRLREFWDTHDSINLGAINRSIAHFESCILDMHRAINCYRRLRRHKGQDPLSLALSADKPSFATDHVADQLRLIRHEIHHLDEMLLDGRIQEGQPTALLYPMGQNEPIPQNQTRRSSQLIASPLAEESYSSLI